MTMRLFPRRDVMKFFSAVGFAIAMAFLPAAPGEAQERPLKIGTIGAGSLGAAVGALWVKAGHEVMFSSRHPEELRSLVEELGPKASAGSVADAIAFGDVVLLAIPYSAYPQVGAEYADALKGKIVIDAGNANRSELYDETVANGIGITSVKYFPGTRLVRAFNAANNRLFTQNANRPAPRMAIPLAGDDAEAIEVVKELISSAGFDPLVVGKLKDADRFAMGTSGFGHVMSAEDLAKELGVTQ